MRWSYIIPRLVFIVIVYVFFYFFFDKLLKIFLIKSLESVFGSKVEIADLKTSFLKGSFRMKKVSVGSLKDEFRNLFEFDELNFEIKPSQLFRRKFIIENAEVKGLLFNGKRKTSARIKKTPSFFSPYIDKYANMVEDFAVERFSDIKREGIERFNFEISNLETIKVLDDIKKNRMEEYKKIYSDVSSFNLDERIEIFEEGLRKLKDEKNFIRQMNLASKLKKDIDDLYRELKDKQKNVNDIFKQTKNLYAEINNAKKKDVERIIRLAKIPSFDTESVAKILFGKVFIERYKTYSVYFEKISEIKKHIPKKTKDRIFEEKRKRGRYISFPLDNSYPSFLLIKAYVSGVLSPENPIVFSASIENISNNPHIYKKPVILNLSGSKDGSYLKFTSKIDVSSDVLKGSLDFKYTGIKISNLKLGHKNLEYLIKSASADVVSSGLFTSNDINLPFKFRFYEVDSSANILITSNKKIDTVIEKTLLGLKDFNVDFIVRGDISKPSLIIKSDVSNLISKQLEENFRKELDSLSSNIEERINLEISKRIEDLDLVLKKEQDKILNKINLGINSVERIKQKIEDEITKKIKI